MMAGMVLVGYMESSGVWYRIQRVVAVCFVTSSVLRLLLYLLGGDSYMMLPAPIPSLVILVTSLIISNLQRPSMENTYLKVITRESFHLHIDLKHFSLDTPGRGTINKLLIDNKMKTGIYAALS